MPVGITSAAQGEEEEEEKGEGSAAESGISPPYSSQGKRSSPRRGRRTLGLHEGYSEAPFDLVDHIIGDLEESFEITSMTPERLRAIQEQLAAAAPELANL